MGKGYNTIAFYPDKCDGCNDCVRTCAYLYSETVDPAHSRIKIVPDSIEKSYGIAQCRQCGEPRCVQDCPAKALTKNEDTGVIQWDEAKCVNCQLCTLACSFAGITYNLKADQVMKCDHCDGDPGCVKACKPGALEYIKAGELYNQWGELEDLFVPGLSAC